MQPKLIEGASRYLGAPKGWKPETEGTCCHLAIRDESGHDRSNRMISAWEPTPAEALAIVAGGHVFLSVVGEAHPPVMLWAEPAPVDPEKVEAVNHNISIYPLIKLLTEGRGESEVWVMIETLCLAAGLLFRRDARGTATFVETIAERMETRFAQRDQRD